jgi:nucleotide-binding universal stress UspA family protein
MENFKKILVGYNDSPQSKAALELAGQLARLSKAHLIIVISMEGGSREKLKDIENARESLDEALRLMSTKGITCEVHQTARGLSPGEDLVAYAKENQVDVIAVGVKKKSKAQKIILGSTAQHIILNAPCPVLTVKSL